MVAYKIFPQHGLILICDWGETSYENTLEFRQKLPKDPEYSQEYDAIYYVMGNLEIHYSCEEVRTLSSLQYQNEDAEGPSGKIALVALEDLSFGLGRMYEIISEGANPHRDVNVFRDVDSALAWLGKQTIDIAALIEEVKREHLPR